MATSSKEEDQNKKDLDKAKDEAKKAVDNAADKAKKEIDSNPDLTPEQKKDLDNKIDSEKNKAIDNINNANTPQGATDAGQQGVKKIEGIVNGLKSDKTQTGVEKNSTNTSTPATSDSTNAQATGLLAIFAAALSSLGINLKKRKK